MRRLIILGWLCLIGCGEVCATGEICERRCPPGGAAVCAAHGLCACLRVPDGGLTGAPELTEPAEAGVGFDAGDPRVTPGETACPVPGIGDLVINEVMLDGEPTEDAEFVELVNLRASPLALAGLRLTSNRGTEQVRRVDFTGGCLPPGAALAVFPRRADWVESSPAAPPIEADLRSFGFANGADFDFRLMRDDMLLDRLSGAGDSIAPGVSLNRSPDLEGPPRPHDVVDPAGAPSSPGLCPSGGRYEDDCRMPTNGVTPALDAGLDPGLDATPERSDLQPDSGVVFDCPAPLPGELRINEVLIDGEIPRTEADEFVEVTSLAPTPLRLRDVSLAIEADDGAPQVRLRFVDGCLPPWGVIVLRPDPADWQIEPAPPIPPVIGEARLALGNESPGPLLLLGDGGELLDRFDPAGLQIVEGVSLNRLPDLRGDDWTLHDRMSDSGRSPGRCADGTPFSAEGCAEAMPPLDGTCEAPTPADLVLNEVLVDGIEDGEPDEFVEVVNPGPASVRLAGLTLWSSQADGVLVERVRFERGCLPPGAMVIRGDRAHWSGLGPDVAARVERLALPNEADVVVELRSDDARWSIEIPRAEVEAGISYVRERDGDADAPWRRHDAISPLSASPGARSDGSAFGADGAEDER